MKNLKAFTLIELVVVIAMLVLLCSLLAQGLASTRPNNSSARCQNNLRILNNAWRMYSDDNRGKLAPSVVGGEALGGAGYTGIVGWVGGWQDWLTTFDNTNVLLLVNERYASMAPYVNRATSVFKCPADRFVSIPQAARGWTQRVRSYSTGAQLGIGNAEEGGWDTRFYRHVTNETELLYPTPAETWVYLDEHPDSMNDPGIFSPLASTWIDYPATYHNGGANVVFADGHAEMHQWVGSLTSPPAKQVSMLGPASIPVTPGDPDLHWMSYHTSRVSTNSY